MTKNIEVFTQSSIRITGSLGTIYVDVFNMDTEPRDADYIFITHDHHDHYSPADIGKVLSEKTVLVVPEKLADTVKRDITGYDRIISVRPEEMMDVNGLQFETVPSYNVNKSFHQKSAGWVGYILNVDGKRIYIAGDMDATDEAKKVRCDIAMVPIGGTYTMDAKEAAELINVIRPEIAIPTHYGSIVGNLKDADVFEKNVTDAVKVEKKIR